MTRDTSGLIKSAIINHLLSDSELTKNVPASQIYGMGVPAKTKWPFIRYGSPIYTSFNPSGFDGTQARISLHLFVETTTLEAGEDFISRVASLIIHSMKAFKGNDNLSLLDCEYIQTNVLQDDAELNRYHAIIEFYVTAEAV